MKIRIIKPIAHCFGVVNAINLAKKVAREFSDKNIFIFGLLVHNDFIKEELEKINVKSLDVFNIDPIKRLKEFTSQDVVIFSAHGHDLKYEEILKDNNVTFFDATCEKVKVAFNYIKNSDEVIYIGKKNHPETKAALTMNPKAYLYDISETFDYSLIKSDSPVVINQTTLSFLELKEIHDDIKNHFPNAKIIDEICNATLLRQKAISNLEDDIDLVLIVGSKKSSNTMKLYEVAKKNNPRKTVLFVENIKDLEGFSLNYKYCAIASGTSTPIKIIEDIKAYLEAK